RIDVLELSDFPLGLGFTELEPHQFQEQRLRLEPGDVLFIGSDGVTEAARNGDYQRGTYGEEGLMALLSANALSSPDEMKTQLLASLETYTAGIYHDHVTFMILRNVPVHAEVAIA